MNGKQRRIEGEEAGGRRLEAYVKSRWPRARGGMRKLAAEVGMTPETLYSWFRGDFEPNLGTLRVMASVLGVRRIDLVAALDGEGDTPGQPVEARLRAVEGAVSLLMQQADVALPTQDAPRKRAG